MKEVICIEDYATAYCTYKRGDRELVIDLDMQHYYAKSTLYILLRPYFCTLEEYRDIQINNLLKENK